MTQLIDREPWRKLVQIVIAVVWTVIAVAFPFIGWVVAGICVIVSLFSRWSNGPYDDISQIMLIAAGLAASGAVAGEYIFGY